MTTFYLLYIGVILLAAFGWFLYTRHRLGIGGKGSATARLAEHDSKISALKTAVAGKKNDALSVHKDIDEVDRLLG